MNFVKSIYAAIIIGLLLCGCSNNKEIQESDYKIILLADTQLSNDETKDNRLADIITAINEGEFGDLDMLVTVGDNVSSFQKDRHGGSSYENQRAVKFIDIIGKIEIPLYLALGNHDYKIDSDKDSDAPFTYEEIDTMETLWKELADVDPYYSFDHKGWNYIFLNSMRGRYLKRAFDDEQLKWFENELQKEKPALLFFHHPIETDNVKIWGKPKDLITPEKEPKFYSIIENYQNHIKGIFVGHGHRWVEDILFGTIPVYETDSFADNENSPFQIIGIDTTLNKIYAERHEYVQ